MIANKKRLYTDVEVLTAVEPARNFRNVDSLNYIAAYIFNEFKKAGATPVEQKWIADGNVYKNVIATYHPEKARRLVLGAHYDVCGDQPGADDNASAVAGLLETARMIFETRPETAYGIDFVAYSLEEPSFFGTDKMGSYIHAKSLADNHTEVIGMVCLEMIGYFSDKPYSQSFPEKSMAKRYSTTGNFITVIGVEKYKDFNQQVFKQMDNTPLPEDQYVAVDYINFPQETGLAAMSDHINYWKFGYPAVMINDTAFMRNSNYHNKSDTIATLNFNRMAGVVTRTTRAITRFTEEKEYLTINNENHE
jgi:Zn-dependent M28 family amino/carboxypeptidase